MEKRLFKNINEKAERQSYITAVLPVKKYEHIRCKLEGNTCFRKVELNMCVFLLIKWKKKSEKTLENHVFPRKGLYKPHRKKPHI